MTSDDQCRGCGTLAPARMREQAASERPVGLPISLSENASSFGEPVPYRTRRPIATAINSSYSLAISARAVARADSVGRAWPVAAEALARISAAMPAGSSWSIISNLALLTFGIDPGLGFAHADVSNRDALALDVMEGARASVDAWLLELLATRPFKAREFIEGRDGRCRLTPPLAHELAASIGRWRSVVAPIVERVVDLIGSADRELSPLVGLAGRKAKPRLARIAEHMPRARIATTVDRRRKHASDAVPERRCHNCGEPFPGKRCEDCGFAPVSVDDAGADRQRAGAMAQARANRDWSGPADDRDFRRDILPGLHGVTLRGIMAATGLSKRFVSQIRNGLAVPHRRHWSALAALSTEKM